MRLFTLLALLVFFCAALPVSAAPAIPSAPSDQGAVSVSRATLGALSPLLTLGVLGLRARMASSGGETLPFYASTGFLVCAGILLVLLVFKDTLGELFPPGKKALDALDVVQNKIFGLAAALAFLPGVAATMKSAVGLGMAHAVNAFLATDAFAAVNMAGAAPHAWLETAASVVAYLLAAIAFFAVWGVSHAVNILIFLAPVPLVGAVLKASRLALLAALAIATVIHPLLGLVLSVLVLILAVKTFGWTARLVAFGTIAATDVVCRLHPHNDRIAAFTANKTARLKKRVYGELSATDGALRFAYRPFFCGPLKVRTLPIPDGLAVMPGIICPAIVDRRGWTLFVLPPRYRGYEAAVARALGGEVEPPTAGHGVRVAIGWVRGAA